MNLNAKTIISTTLILLCGICADGHAKSKKHKDKNKNKHTETQVKSEPIQPKIQQPITQIKAKEVVVETPKAKIEQPVVEEEVVVITYDPVHEEKIEQEVKQEVAVDSLCESEELHEHIAENTEELHEHIVENTAETHESNI